MDENVNLANAGNQAQSKFDHPCFPQPVNSLARVWRYLDLAKFIWMLENQKLYLSRLDLLNDPHEGSIPKLQATQYYNETFSHSYAMEIESLVKRYGGVLTEENLQELMPQFIKHVQQSKLQKKESRKNFYVNCWHLNDFESEAMWRLYCPNGNGVAIQTSYKKLAEFTMHDPELYIGNVTYLDYESNGFPMDNVFYSVMHKRLSFAHENEIRLVKLKIPDNWGTPIEFSAQGIPFDLPYSIIDAIYVDPYAPEYYYDAVRAIVNRIAPQLTELVVWSKMRLPPEY